MRWTPSETAALVRMHAGGVPAADMATRLGRSRTAVLQRITEAEAAEALANRADRAELAALVTALTDSVAALERAVDRRIAES